MNFQLKGKQKKPGIGGTPAPPAEEPGSALTPGPGDLMLSSGLYGNLDTVTHRLRLSAHTQT